MPLIYVLKFHSVSKIFSAPLPPILIKVGGFFKPLSRYDDQFTLFVRSKTVITGTWITSISRFCNSCIRPFIPSSWRVFSLSLSLIKLKQWKSIEYLPWCDRGRVKVKSWLSGSVRKVCGRSWVSGQHFFLYLLHKNQVNDKVCSGALSPWICWAWQKQELFRYLSRTLHEHTRAHTYVGCLGFLEPAVFKQQISLL